MCVYIYTCHDLPYSISDKTLNELNFQGPPFPFSDHYLVCVMQLGFEKFIINPFPFFNSLFPLPSFLHSFLFLFNSQTLCVVSLSAHLSHAFTPYKRQFLFIFNPFVFGCQKMSKRSRSSEAEVELRVNLNQSPTTSSSSSSVSTFGGSGSGSGDSCLSCEGEDQHGGRLEEIITRSMMLVGCPGCFMYVMLTEKSSQCPKCKNNVFLDFFKQQPQHHAQLPQHIQIIIIKYSFSFSFLISHHIS